MIVVKILLVGFALMWAFAVTGLLRAILTELRLARRRLEAADQPPAAAPAAAAGRAEA